MTKYKIFKIAIFSNSQGSSYSVKWFTGVAAKYLTNSSDRELHTETFDNLKSAEAYAKALKKYPHFIKQ